MKKDKKREELTHGELTELQRQHPDDTVTVSGGRGDEREFRSGAALCDVCRGRATGLRSVTLVNRHGKVRDGLACRVCRRTGRWGLCGWRVDLSHE